jgi:hypothetical protein
MDRKQKEDSTKTNRTERPEASAPQSREANPRRYRSWINRPPGSGAKFIQARDWDEWDALMGDGVYDIRNPRHREELTRTSRGIVDADSIRIISPPPGERTDGKPVHRLVKLDDEEPGNAGASPQGYGMNNRFYPREAADEAIARLKQNPISRAEDPTEAQLEAMRNIAGYHVEAGSREFGAWTRKMLDDLGEAVIPYLPDLHEHATMCKDLSEILEREWKAGKITDTLYSAMKLKTAK